MKIDSLYVNADNDYSRSNHYYSLACQDENNSSSKGLLKKAINFNSQNYDARIDLIFLDHLPIEKEVEKLVSLYEEIKKEFEISSFLRNKKGVFSLHEEGRSFLRLINHILDDYSTINNPREIIKYAKTALDLDFSDTLEIKKYLAFSYLSLNDFHSYEELKKKYPNSNIFHFTDCYYYILSHKFVEAYQLALKLKDENNWIANYILFNEHKNILGIYNSEKETPISISLAVDFIICSFLISDDTIKNFHIFVSYQLLKNYSLSIDEKRLLCCLNYKNFPFQKDCYNLDLVASSINNNEETFFQYNWLINVKGRTIVSALETLQNKGIIFSYNKGYKFTYLGLRLSAYFKEPKIVKRLFKNC